MKFSFFTARRCPPLVALTATWFLLASTPLQAQVSKSVELNVVTGSRAPFNSAQEWARALSKLKSVRVRVGGGRASQPQVKHTGNLIEMTGVIDGSNKLVFPRKSFTMRQTAALQTWIDGQRTGSGKPVEASDDRFGLTSTQLKKAHAALKAVVRNSTLDQPVRSVVSAIAKQTGLRLRSATGTQTAMANAKVNVELKDFTSGTALAAALRPLELVIVPQASSGGQLELLISHERAVKEGWPVGWDSPLKDDKLVPKLYDMLPIEVYETPIGDVMTALTTRLETPLLYDEGLLTLKGIDPATAKVTYTSKKTYYSKIIRQTLFKAKLKAELLVDERGKPFYWVSPSSSR